ncbi:MAG: GspH/FimT family pseudopilin [Chitinivibrionia bacterium]|nr:GspH/FimT family pseudopilin [Chitinivibrionia bacterium]
MKNKGFNLVELMVSIVILGIVLAMSLPAFGRFVHTWRLKGSADQLSTALRTARSAAVMKHTNAVFQIDLNRNEYFFYEDLNGNGSRESAEYRSATYELANGISFQGLTLPSAIITFGPKGNTSSSGTITLQDLGSRTRAVRIFGGTGTISLD